MCIKVGCSKQSVCSVYVWKSRSILKGVKYHKSGKPKKVKCLILNIHDAVVINSNKNVQIKGKYR